MLFLALEVDVCEGVDDLDDTWGEAVAAAFDAHDDVRANLYAVERVVAEVACRCHSDYALAVRDVDGRVLRPRPSSGLFDRGTRAANNGCLWYI